MERIIRFTVATILFCGVSLLLIGCGEEEDPLAAPTAASFFPFAVPTERPTSTPQPTGTPLPTPRPTPVIVYDTIPIFEDSLSGNWAIEPDRMDYQTTVRNVYTGTTALRITPRDDFAALLFVVDEASELIFPRDNIYGFSFYMSGGPNPIGNEDFAIAVQGSNFYEWWVPFDESARVDDGPIFSESLLLYFELNNAIPPNTWVKIEVPLDELLFDPPYEYFTGFYIKNDLSVADTIYIDQVELITRDFVYPDETVSFAEASTAERTSSSAEGAPFGTTGSDVVFTTVPIFDDTEAEGWRLTTDRVSFEYTQVETFSGESGIRVIPEGEFASFYVVVDGQDDRTYNRDEVIGVRFQLNGGTQPIDPTDLTVAMQGSNDFTYWRDDDDSALTQQTAGFSETRLEFLGVTEEIPANTWVEIEIILDDLIFDPEYEYFTGFYIKNDPKFISPFYIDQIELITGESIDETDALEE